MSKNKNLERTISLPNPSAHQAKPPTQGKNMRKPHQMARISQAPHLESPLQAPHGIVHLLDHRQHDQRLVDRHDQLGIPRARDAVHKPDGRERDQNPGVLPNSGDGDDPGLLGAGGVGIEEGLVLLDEVGDLDWGNLGGGGAAEKFWMGIGIMNWGAIAEKRRS